MKVLMINGSPHAKGNTYIALHEMEQQFAKNDIETEMIHIGNKDIRGCIACGSCATTGKCVFDDVVNEIALKFEEADGLVVGTPVYYASANATLIALLTRLFFSTSFDKTMKVGAGVTVARRGGLSSTFDELNKLLYHFGNAYRIKSVLEQCPWQRAGRGNTGRRGTTDNAYTCR